MASLTSFAFVTPETVISYSALGMIHRLLITAKETDAAYSLTEIAVSPGAGVPMHKHPGQEAFYVLEGTFAFGIGDAVLTGHAGDFVTIPPLVFHIWKNVGDTQGRVLCLLVPGGMEQMFVEGSHLVTDRAAPPLAPTAADAELTTAAALRHGVEFPPEQPAEFPPHA